VPDASNSKVSETRSLRRTGAVDAIRIPSVEKDIFL